MILSMAAKQLPTDWESRYHYCPVLLETFVEKDRFVGNVLQSRQLDLCRRDQGAGKAGAGGQAECANQGHVALSADAGLQIDADQVIWGWAGRIFTAHWLSTSELADLGPPGWVLTWDLVSELSVRRVWDLNARHLEFTNPNWEILIDSIVDKLRQMN